MYWAGAQLAIHEQNWSCDASLGTGDEFGNQVGRIIYYIDVNPSYPVRCPQILIDHILSYFCE
jgi:hypothetical protein